MSKVKFSYGGIIVSPAPIMSVDKEFIYVNDSVIGYTYIINLTGYASSVVGSNTTSSFLNTVLSIKDIQKIFHKNGQRLLVYCEDGNNSTILIDAHGGQVRSFNIEETENKWLTYAKYSVTLEFSNVFFGSNTNIEIGSSTLANNPFYSDLIKLKSYSDNWNFTISEEDMYSYYSRSVDGAPSIEDYTKINVEYTISANGKHFFDVNGVLKPAWQVAKDFVQKKLYNQIKIFRDSNKGPLGVSTFNSTNYDSTDIQYDLSNSLDHALSSTYELSINPTILPILDSSITQNYKIYNEIIFCSTSESDGTFTATYKCILKRFSNPSIFPQNSIHTFTVSYDQILDFNNNNRIISVNGTVQGLVPTNILAPTTYGGQIVSNNGEVFSLPNQGYFIDTFHASNVTKYTYALQDFITYISKTTSSLNQNSYSADDLSDGFKKILSINYATLFPNTDYNNAVLTCKEGAPTLSSLLALPQSFSVDHNYSQGSISYTAEYSTERSCAMERGFERFTVTENDAVPMYAEFLVPGRANGPIVQNLNSYKNKRITFDFEGITKKGCVGGTPFAIGYTGTFENVCGIDDYMEVPQKVLCMIRDTEMKHPELIEESYSISYSPIDGGYKLSKTYMICPVIDTTECTEE